MSQISIKAPHDQLKTRMSCLINDAFTCRNAKYIEVHSTYASWSSGASTSNKDSLCLMVQQVIDLFNYLINNIYIQVGSVVFKQAIGIPMGTDCAPLIADLFLFSLKFDFMRDLLRKDLLAARRFCRTFRYIDDLLTLNNSSFKNSIDTPLS